jgi:fibronectin type 3 domain-containing protein
MRKVTWAVGVVLLTSLVASADTTVKLQWNANTESDLAGYRLYQSNTSGVYTTYRADIPAPTHEVTVTIPTDGTYFWVVTAYDTSGNESGRSNEATLVIDTTPPGPPTGCTAVKIP